MNKPNITSWDRVHLEMAAFKAQAGNVTTYIPDRIPLFSNTHSVFLNKANEKEWEESWIIRSADYCTRNQILYTSATWRKNACPWEELAEKSILAWGPNYYMQAHVFTNLIEVQVLVMTLHWLFFKCGGRRAYGKHSWQEVGLRPERTGKQGWEEPVRRP